MSVFAVLENLRRRFEERVGDTVPAVLGDGRGRVFASTLNRIYVRLVLGGDDNGNPLYSTAFIVHAGASPAYRAVEGYKVRVGLNYSGELAIIEGDTTYMDAVGEDAQAGNVRSPTSRWLIPDMWAEAFNTANGTANTPSTEVSVSAIRVVNGYGEYRYWGGGKINLASTIPAIDQQRVVLVYLKRDMTLGASASTTQSLFTALDETDIDEALLGMDAEGIPLGLYRLSNAQTVIRDSDKLADMRSFINAPPKYGFPHTVRNRERVHPNYSVVTHGVVTIKGDGVLTVNGVLWIK